ncbi:hypothetical protein BMETH_1946_0 [methanotrophic bacterial endosymbiont of Bathymodiolus sp.]|nr:hypothetical protein BMETH_1946_0 [methanotrophic bacterial endosymbiont of Bathymodiolus sp.]
MHHLKQRQERFIALKIGGVDILPIRLKSYRKLIMY